MKSFNNKQNLTNIGYPWILSMCVVFFSFLLNYMFLGNNSLYSGDAKYYLSSANSPLTGGDPFFSPRILTPVLVNITPLSHEIMFTVISLTAMVWTGVCFALYLKKLGFVKWDFFWGLLLLLFSPIYIYSCFHVISVDPLFFLLWVAGFFGVIIENYILVGLLILCGVFQKESIIGLSIPYLFNYASSRKIMMIKFIFIIGAVVFFLGIRLFLHTGTGYSIEYFTTLYGYHADQLFGLLRIPAMIYLSFGAIWLILGYGIIKKISIPWFSKITVILFMGYLIILALVATGGHRMIFLAFPLIIPYAILIIPHINLKIRHIIILICIITSFISLIIGIISRYPESHFFVFAIYQIIIAGMLLSKNPNNTSFQAKTLNI